MWVLYLFLLLLYLGYLVVAVPLAMAAAAIVYTFGVPVSYLRGLAAVLGRRPGRPPEPAHWPKPPADGDPALLQYFYGPARADAALAVRVGFSKCQRLWEFGGEMIGEAFEADASWLTMPLGIGGAIGLGLGTVLGAPIAAVIGVIHLLGIAVSAALVRACGALLRLLDSAMLRVRNVKMVCPNCYERVPYPAYQCPNPACRNRHRDVRPGRYGILHRRCNCGTQMSTLLLLGSSRMEAFCPHRGCEQPLEHRPGEVPEIVLPFFGATGAGKTRLLYSMITQLQEWTDSEKLTAGAGDSATADGLQVASTLVRSGRTTIGTPVQLPRAHVIRLSVDKSTWILQLYDAAGERFYEAARTEELRYLNKARTFVLVIDPLSVESFWQQLAEDVKRELGSQRSTAPSPDLAYQQTYQQIEAMGVPLSKARLAVVFSRADLVGEIDGDAAEWARADLGLGNLIRSIAQNFKETRYFRTAAVMDDGHVHTSVTELLGWLLAPDGIQLPAGSGCQPTNRDRGRGRQTVADSEAMTLQVHPGPDDDAGELAELTARLRAELLELDVAGAEQLPVGDVPAGAMGVAAVTGWLAVQLGPEALRTVLKRVADWAARNDRSVEVTYGTDTIKLDRLSREQQDRFIDDWLARHRAGG